MRTIVNMMAILFLLFAASLFPRGYDVGKKVFNGKLHNEVYCAIFELMKKHELTQPDKSHVADYLSKCMIEHQNKKQRQIDDFIKENGEKLKIKKEVFDLEKK